MWINRNGQLIQTRDVSRVKFRTSISKSIIDEMKELAEANNSHPNYLIETGIRRVLDEGIIAFDKKSRPKDRVQYQTTYDADLLRRIKELSRSHGLYVNDLIEYCCRFVDPRQSRSMDYRYTIER